MVLALVVLLVSGEAGKLRHPTMHRMAPIPKNYLRKVVPRWGKPGIRDKL